jgi:CheY-like chemotaxis protein
MQRAFEPFFTTKEVGKGTGLGLPQVYGFAKQSGGDVTIESEVGRGTKISICLPASDGSEQNDHAEAGEGQTILRASGKLVLVVDDNPEIAAFAATMLEGLGYATLKASSATEALALLEKGEPIDVVFSDIVMPGPIGGIELATILKAKHPNVGLVLATGYYGQRELLDRTFEVLDKPYGLDELKCAVERSLQAASGTKAQ